MYANVDAAAVLDRAVAAGTRWRGARPEAVMRAAEALGDVRLSLGEFDRARAAFAIARAACAATPSSVHGCLRKEAVVAYRLGAYSRAQRILKVALAMLEGASSVPATAQRARIEAWLGIITLWRGHPREAVEILKRAIADAESVDAKEALAHAFAGLDVAYNSLGDSRLATNSARALELYRELGDLVREGGVLNNLGLIAYFAGRWNEALDYYRQAVAAWDQAGDTRSVSMASFNIGEILSAQGRLDEAEPLLREAERASRAAGGMTDLAESVMETALLDVRRGNLERALTQLEEARALAREDREPVGVAPDRRARRGGARARRRVRSRRGTGGSHARPRERGRGERSRAPGAQPRARPGPPRRGAARSRARGAGARHRRGQPRRAPLRGSARARRAAPARRRPGEAALRRDALFEQLGIVALPAGWSTPP